MAIKPILFNTEMVRAIMDGRKSCTRRICKDANECTVPDMDYYDPDKRTYAVHNYADGKHTDKLSIAERTCPICPGDILYVRETIWQKVRCYLDVNRETQGIFCHEYRYVATDKEPETGWNFSWVKRPSIHMPKEAARIWLRVTDVRVERLQEISAESALTEGADKYVHLNGKFDENAILTSFIGIWDSTIKKSDLDYYGWSANPWVWVIEFERCEAGGIDEK